MVGSQTTHRSNGQGTTSQAVDRGSPVPAIASWAFSKDSSPDPLPPGSALLQVFTSIHGRKVVTLASWKKNPTFNIHSSVGSMTILRANEF